jgi:hypothetical protein
MEDRLKALALPRTGPINTYEELSRLYAIYTALSHTPGWLDFTSRLTNMRDELVRELLTGTVDTHGVAHDDEKRAVLVYVNRALAFTPTLLDTYIQWTKKRDNALEKSKRRANLHDSQFTLPPGVTF